jgi:hypothetical protein
LDNTDVTAILAAYQALLNARLGRRESVAWYLDSVLPQPSNRIAMAIQFALVACLEDYEEGELASLYLELARFIPHEFAALPPRKLNRLIARRRVTLTDELNELGFVRFGGRGACSPPRRATRVARMGWRAWIALLFASGTPRPLRA